jgi:hypothetical protein
VETETFNATKRTSRRDNAANSTVAPSLTVLCSVPVRHDLHVDQAATEALGRDSLRGPGGRPWHTTVYLPDAQEFGL